MPQGAPLLAHLRCRLATHPAQPGTRQADPVFFAPGRQVFGRVTHRAAHALQVIRVDALEYRRGILAQLLQVNFVYVVQAHAGIRKAGMAVAIQAVLINAARHLGTELFQKAVTGRQRLMHPTPFGDIDADRQVTDPQPLFIEHGGDQHVGHQLAAIGAQQGPLPRLGAMLLHRFGEHGLATFNRSAVTQAQGMGTQAQFLGQHQVLQAQLADRLAGGITEHAFGAGVECTDHALEVGGDDRHLGCGIQHAAQLVVGATQ